MGWMVVIICNFLCMVDMLLFGYVLGLLLCLFDVYGWWLGDMVVCIVVIYIGVLVDGGILVIDSVLLLL